MKRNGIYKSMGVLILIVTTLINRFVYVLPDIIDVPLTIIAIVLIIIGFYKDKDDKKIIF